jgi:hypothetical protein
MPTLHPAAQTPICPACGCSLARLRVPRDTAATRLHQGREHLLCCEGCAGVFDEDPDRFLAEIRDIVVCPSCLAEKDISRTVELEHEGGVVRLCRCPGCAEAFKKDPDRLLQRLAL